ncbi:MAG: hypothetical protein SGJ23_15005 [Alphaproteobacteria bacterium]|nr:hypothetical protein [Alphaproteobacteria bacterium]
MIIRLTCDSLVADLAPLLGGAIAAFRDGETMLMTPAGPNGVCEFPMGPWVNRLAGGSLHWGNETAWIPRNTAEHEFPIHGVGWRAPWDVVAQSERHAVLRLARDADAHWPWAGLVMTRTFTLSPGVLEVRFEATHDDPRPMPVALGLHPYFPVRDALVKMNVEGYWRTINDVPNMRAEIPLLGALREGAVMSAHKIDNGLDGWDGRAEIVWPEHRLTIETDPPQRFVQLYMPRGRGYFCLEPQSAMPGGSSHEAGPYAIIARGETFGFTTRIAFSRMSHAAGP